MEPSDVTLKGRQQEKREAQKRENDTDLKSNNPKPDGWGKSTHRMKHTEQATELQKKE